MFKKFIAGLLIAGGAGLFQAGYTQDKSKKTYELIYEDVQTLKKQVQQIREQNDRQAEEIRQIQEQLKNIAELIRQISSRQRTLEEGLAAVPLQYQDLAQKIDRVAAELLRISASLAQKTDQPQAAGSPGSAASADQSPEKAGKPIPPPKGKETGAKETEAAGQPAAGKVPSLSSQEMFGMAYNDYLKGNFDLAVASFKLYRQQFPESPLADDALYWIGEALYSQKKYVEAIDRFDEMLVLYPASDKTAAALLKKGFCLIEVKKREEALAAFRILVAKYPFEGEARIASEKIKELTTK